MNLGLRVWGLGTGLIMLACILAEFAFQKKTYPPAQPVPAKSFQAGLPYRSLHGTPKPETL